MELDSRGRRLRAALAAVLVKAQAPELRLVHRWLDSWSGIGLVAARMAVQRAKPAQLAAAVSMAQRLQRVWHLIDPKGDHRDPQGERRHIEVGARFTSRQPHRPAAPGPPSEIPAGSAGEALFAETHWRVTRRAA